MRDVDKFLLINKLSSDIYTSQIEVAVKCTMAKCKNTISIVILSLNFKVYLKNYKTTIEMLTTQSINDVKKKIFRSLT